MAVGMAAGKPATAPVSLIADGETAAPDSDKGGT